MALKRKPDWLRVKLPGQGEYRDVDKILKDLDLHTVCRSARCPNIADCWGQRTATIMILGDVCTRFCRFCAVTPGNPRGYVDETEPGRVAEAVRRMKLRYVVLTSVDRDDLADGGAEHFARTIRLIKEQDPNVLVEPLIPDFGVGARHAVPSRLKKIIDAKPDVIAHNLETVERLTPHVRDRRSSYTLSLDVLKTLKELEPRVVTKSGIMVGLGETDDEVYQALQDMRGVGVEIVTIGQYLQPTRKHLEVERFVTPEQFAEYEERGKEMGFLSATCAPLVRSSYHAAEAASIIRNRKRIRDEKPT
ncbi:MAG: lipoyl synthase [Candidatus Stahlbacteria bacterium]|nr:MAG: lipoyl synthase [Candidatus Stahlbacteria bacterium]